MGPLPCFSLAFDNSKTQLEKDVLKQNFQISQKTQLRDGLFSIQAKPKNLLHYDRHKKVGFLCYFSVDFDNSKSQLKKNTSKKLCKKAKNLN